MPKLTKDLLDRLVPSRMFPSHDEPESEPTPEQAISEAMSTEPPGRYRRSESALLLDELKLAMGIDSDYRAADILGVTRSTVSKWRQDKGGMSEETALKAAYLIGYDPAYVLLRIQLEQAQTMGARNVLAELVTQIEQRTQATVSLVGKSAAAIVAAFVATLALSGMPVKQASAASTIGGESGPIYTLCEVRYLQSKGVKAVHPGSPCSLLHVVVSS